MNAAFRAMPEVKAGTPILDVFTATRINAIQDMLRLLYSGENLRSGGNCHVQPSANGPTINVVAGGGGSGTSGLAPFALYKDAGGLRVNRGSVGGVIPSNIGSSFSLTDGPVVLTVTLSNEFIGKPTAAVISQGSAPADTKTQASIILGEVVGGVIYQHVSGSLAFAQTRYDSIDEPEAEPAFANCFGRV